MTHDAETHLSQQEKLNDSLQSVYLPRKDAHRAPMMPGKGEHRGRCGQASDTVVHGP
jgi:hypothetical protein